MMTPDDSLQLGALLTDVMKYYRQPPTEFLLDVWWRACRVFRLADVRRAISAHIADPERGRFVPMVSDVVRQLSGTAGDRAVAAWGKVYDAMGRVGSYTDVIFDDPAVHVVVHDMGGWPKLCRTENADLSYAQHRFVEFYKSVSERGVEGYPRMLAGDRAADSEWERKGLQAPSPVLIGDPAACALVHANGGDPRTQITALPAGAASDLLAQLPSGLQVKRLTNTPAT